MLVAAPACNRELSSLNSLIHGTQDRSIVLLNWWCDVYYSEIRTADQIKRPGHFWFRYYLLSIISPNVIEADWFIIGKQVIEWYDYRQNVIQNEEALTVVRFVMPLEKKHYHINLDIDVSTGSFIFIIWLHWLEVKIWTLDI